MHALGRGHQVLAAALHIADLDQPLDDRRTRGRCAQRAVLHLLAQRLVLNLPPRVLHLAQQGGVVVLLGRLGLLLAGPRGFARLRVAHGKRRQLLLVLGCLALFLGLLAVDRLPALLRHALAGGDEVVPAHPRHDAQRVVFVIGIEHRRQPARHHLVELSLVCRQVHVLRAFARRDDRVVIGQLRVVEHAWG